MAPIFRFPRPRSFLHIISLRTATEFILFLLCLNKVTGLYGLLAILTGYTLNPLQLSHYIYSLLVLGLIVWLSPAVRQRDEVLKNVALAWVYVLDTVVNSVYTSLFATGWFLVLAQHLDEAPARSIGKGLGTGTMNETAGFTTPEVEGVKKVEVVATPAPGVLSGQEAVAYATTTSGGIGGAVFQDGGMASITVLGLLWLIRIYFCIIVLAHARSMLRQYIANNSSQASYSQAADSSLADSPFRAGQSHGEGWRGKVGRLMLRFPTQRYWLGRDDVEEDEWARATSGRLESAKGLRIKVPENGVGERERRARSGTGPPLLGALPKGKA